MSLRIPGWITSSGVPCQASFLAAWGTLTLENRAAGGLAAMIHLPWPGNKVAEG